MKTPREEARGSDGRKLARPVTLTQRQRDVLRLRKEGLTFTQIGRALKIDRMVAYQHYLYAMAKARTRFGLPGRPIDVQPPRRR